MLCDIFKNPCDIFENPPVMLARIFVPSKDFSNKKASLMQMKPTDQMLLTDLFIALSTLLTLAFFAPDIIEIAADSIQAVKDGALEFQREAAQFHAHAFAL